MRYKFKTKPMPHQLKSLRRGLRTGLMGLLWEPGTGKSKAIVDWVCALHMQGRLDRILIVCPLSVIGVWEDEFDLHAPIKYRVHLFDKSDKVLPEPKSGILQIIVVNYDLVWRRQELVKKYDPQCVVADESHKIKKASARRSRYMRKLNGTQFKAILTGTPTPKSFLDLYSQWVFFNPKRFGTRVEDYKDEYIRYGGYMKHQVKGYKNVDQLNRKVREDASIVLEDVLNLQEPRYQRVPVQLEPAAWKAYEKMAFELFLELKNGEVSDAKNVAVKILRLQQITGGWIKSDEGNIHQISSAKIDALNERMENLFDADKAVVVFARFKPELDAITALGTKFDVPTYVLRGGVGREERDTSRRAFQAGSGARLFLAQIQAGGLGITLHSSHEGIFYSVTYALDEYIQACKRLQRKGQVNQVRYQHIVARSTVDIDLYSSLQAKEDMQNLLMGRTGRRRLMVSLARNLGIDP